jgi:hypothetical protein
VSIRCAIVSDADLVEINASPHPERYVVAGALDLSKKRLSLIKGDLSVLDLSIEIFKMRLCAPDFTRFSIIDCGQTLAFGEYQAAVDSLN